MRAPPLRTPACMSLCLLSLCWEGVTLSQNNENTFGLLNSGCSHHTQCKYHTSSYAIQSLPTPPARSPCFSKMGNVMFYTGFKLSHSLCLCFCLVSASASVSSVILCRDCLSPFLSLLLSRLGLVSVCLSVCAGISYLLFFF